MSEKKPQNYENHAKFIPVFHYIALPLLLVNFFGALFRVTQEISFYTLNGVGLAISLIVVAVFTRLFALKAQDRVIRLEEQIRMQTFLPDALKAQVGRLTMGQIVALRFASDEELVDLTQDALNQNTSPNALKQAVKNWRPDYDRV
jgi:cell division protein FtsL